MLTPTQLTQIREKLESSQNPLFFFDNDADGLCSFIILQRALGRGKGVAVKYPELNKNYLRKVNELRPDGVFILDKPQVSEDFIQELHSQNIPVTWIDHHNVKIKKELLEKVSYFNSYPSSEPVTYISYNVYKRKQDMWLAMIGCIGDVYMPDFAEEFSKQNPELFNSSIPVFDCLYLTEIGKIVKILNFGLKDTTTNVLNMMRILIKAESPHDILEETPQTKHLHYKFNQINKEYTKIIEKAEHSLKGNLLFFTYAGATSMTSEISNELYFRHHDKKIVVVYKKQDTANISFRGKDIKPITEKAIKGLKDAIGGGHQDATGARINIDDFPEFKKRIEKLISS